MIRNLVLICLDCVRKDRYDKLASRIQERTNIRFQQCRAASAWSAPSHASMLTGQLPHEHNVHSYDYDFSKISFDDTFLDGLTDYEIIGVSANPFACSAYGFDDFFDVWQDVRPELLFDEGMNVKQFTWERDTEGLELYLEFVREAIKHNYPLKSLSNGLFTKAINNIPPLPIPRLRDDGSKNVCKYSKNLIRKSREPFFLFTNFMDAHGPYAQILAHNTSIYNAPNDWSSNNFDKVGTNISGGLNNPSQISHYRGLYEADIEYIDRLVSRFISDVQKMTNEPTIFIITADHGQNLAYDREDSLIAHMGTLSEGTLHVPLDIVVPEISSKDIVDDYVSHLQLGMLLKGFAEGESPDIRTDHPRAEIVGGAGAQGRLDEDDNEYDLWTRGQRCVYSGSEKFWWDSLGESMVYELKNECPNFECRTQRSFDPDELDAKWFHQAITDVKQTVEGRANQETSARLKDLGYL